ncbi:hypothetical protein Tco_1214524 [Tanacetum coccineum]
MYPCQHSPKTTKERRSIRRIQKKSIRCIKDIVDSSVRRYMSGHILHVHPAKDAIPSTQEQQYQLYLTIKEDPQPFDVRLRDQDDPHDDAHPEGENSNQEQSDEFDYWTNSYAIDDDVLPNEKVSQELVDEISQTVDEAKLRKVVDEMLRQQCTSRDEHQCKRDPKAPGLPLVNQDLLYLKKGNSRPDKIVLSLHKFPAVIFPNDDIEDRTSRRVKKCMKRFNPYARYEVDDYAETGSLWSLSVSIRSTTIWERVNDFQLGIEKYKMFSIISELVYGIIYENNKKEKRVMRHQEIHKFCDATLKRVLEGLKSYNNDVKYGYVTHNLSKEDIEYLQLFAEEIEEWLKYRDQMRRWEMYVNGRPLGSRRERPK